MSQFFNEQYQLQPPYCSAQSVYHSFNYSVMKNNHFNFNGYFYLPVSETTSYANLLVSF